MNIDINTHALAELAALATCTAGDLDVADDENPLSVLGWALGESVMFESGLVSFVKETARLCAVGLDYPLTDTDAQPLAEAAARATCEEHDIDIEKGVGALSALGWQMGESVTYERALIDLAKHTASIHTGTASASAQTRAALHTSYLCARRASEKGSNDDEISLLWELVEDLMAHAGIETD